MDLLKNPLPDGGAPIYAKDLVMLQETARENYNSIVASLAGTNEGIILDGGVPTDNGATVDITAGRAYMDGNIVDFAAYSGGYPVWLTPDTDSVEQRFFQDNVQRDAVVTKQLKWVTSDPGSVAKVLYTPDTSQMLTDVLFRQSHRAGSVQLYVGNGLTANSKGLFDGTGLGQYGMAGWALCNGNNGTVNMNGRFPVGYDSGDSDYDAIGDTGGEKEHTLTESEMPIHDHMTVREATVTSDTALTASNSLAERRDIGSDPVDEYALTSDGSASDPTAARTSNSGSGAAHENRPPYFTVQFIQRI